MSSNIDEIRRQVQSLKEELNSLKPEIRDANRLLTMYVALAHEAGVEGPAVEAVAKFLRIKIAAEAAYRSVLLLYSATGPLGIALGAGGTMLGGLMLVSQLQELRRPHY